MKIEAKRLRIDH